MKRVAPRSSLWLFAVTSVAAAFACLSSHDAKAEDAINPMPAAATTPDPDVAKLLEARHSIKWNYVPAGKSDRYGHAEVLIHAPLSKVRSQVMNYNQYKEFDPRRFNKSHIVAKEAGNTDVYMELPLVGGMITLSQTLRFTPLQKPAPGVEAVEGKFVTGKNIRDSNVVMTMKAITPQVTLLKCDLLVAPTIPAPQWAVDEELRDAAMKAVDALHDRAQGSIRQVVALNPVQTQ